MASVETQNVPAVLERLRTKLNIKLFIIIYLNGYYGHSRGSANVELFSDAESNNASGPLCLCRFQRSGPLLETRWRLKTFYMPG